MKQRVRALVVMTLVAATVAGCGSGGNPDGDASATTAAGAATSSTTAGPVGSGSPGDPGAAGVPAAGDGGAGAGAAPAGGGGPPASQPNDAAPADVVTADPSFPFTVTVTPRCVERGATLQVSLLTRAGASVAGAVGFSDDDSHGALTVGYANGDGAFNWTVPIEPTVPDGPATVLISAQDRTTTPEGSSTTGESGSGEFPIEVRAQCL